MPEMTEEGGSFPPGIWQIEIQGMKGVQQLPGECIQPEVYGCFFQLPGAPPDVKPRWAFWPWHKITRMYEVTKVEEGK